MSGPGVALASPGVGNDVPALPGCGWVSPEDGQVKIGGVVGAVPRDRAFDEHGCYFGVGMNVRGDLLRQGIAPATCFLHQKPPDGLLSSAQSLAPKPLGASVEQCILLGFSWKRESSCGSRGSPFHLTGEIGTTIRCFADVLACSAEQTLS